MFFRGFRSFVWNRKSSPVVWSAQHQASWSSRPWRDRSHSWRRWRTRLSPCTKMAIKHECSNYRGCCCCRRNGGDPGGAGPNQAGFIFSLTKINNNRTGWFYYVAIFQECIDVAYYILLSSTGSDQDISIDNISTRNRIPKFLTLQH